MFLLVGAGSCSIFWLAYSIAVMMSEGKADTFLAYDRSYHGLLTHRMQTTNACEAGADMLELNLSCPHGMGERGMGMVTGSCLVVTLLPAYVGLASYTTYSFPSPCSCCLLTVGRLSQ